MQECVARKISFLDLCLIFNTIKESTSSNKRKYFDKFLRRWRNLMIKHDPIDNSFEFNTSNSFYPAMRLFVPSIDDRAFGIKEVHFGFIFILKLINFYWNLINHQLLYIFKFFKFI